MVYHTLQLEFSGAIATITLNRPEKRNAISTQMIAELFSAFDHVETNSARVLLVTGAGKAFCAGMDLDELKSIAAQSPVEHLEDARRIARLYRRIWSFPKPTIAAVNGPAIAGGCGIATLCDFTISVPEATFGYPEVRIGFLPAVVSVFLTRQVGEKHARDLLLTGRIVGASEAQRLGLITKTAPAGDLMNAARVLADSLLGSSPASLRQAKKLLCDRAAPEIDRELELATAEGARIRSTADFREGLASFLEKRPPRWTSK
ncbi:MAG TPA: enoyl-CoA hydratase-related protein [Candidatus Dormibacteraeota bacterium]|nr:enoyl-CoA hydratase-related protein [Candidatus Dormibacteraeota bacterium]